MVFVGTFFLRVIPNGPTYSPLSGSDERSGSESSTLLKRTKSTESRQGITRLSHEPGTLHDSISFHEGPPNDHQGIVKPDARNPGTEETSSLLSKSDGSGPGDVPYQNGEAKSAIIHDSHHLDIRGLALLSKIEFYQLWLLLGLLTGIGLMTIK